MKKLIIPALAVALMMASCGGNSSKPAGNAADSTAKTEVKAEAKADEAPKSDANCLVTPDLSFCQVKGNVHYIVENTVLTEFDKSGKLILWKSSDTKRTQAERETDDDGNFTENPGFVRNDKGQIVSIGWVEGSEDYVWADNRVDSIKSFCEGMYDDTKLSYDNDGNVVKVSTESGSEFDDAVSKVSAELVYEFDKNGNWIKRSSKDKNENWDAERQIIYFGEEGSFDPSKFKK